MTDIFDQIDLFMLLPRRNVWIVDEAMDIYLRKSSRVVEGKGYNFIDFASIEVTKQGEGFFTAFLAEFRKMYPTKNIFVESILNKRFAEFLVKKGFTIIPNHEPQIDAYLLNQSIQ